MREPIHLMPRRANSRRSALARGSPAAVPRCALPHRWRSRSACATRTVDALRVHAAAGRLSTEDLEARVERALAARTRAELDAVQADLPARPRRTRPAPDVRAEWLSYAAVAAVLVCVWALAGAGAFWPAWPMGFWGAALALKRVRAA